MFNNRIKEIRLHRGMTQAELAAKSGLSQAQISRLEKEGFKRSANVTLETLECIAKALDICPSYLLTYDCSVCALSKADKQKCFIQNYEDFGKKLIDKHIEIYNTLKQNEGK